MPNRGYVYDGSSWVALQGGKVVRQPEISELVLTSTAGTITITKGEDPNNGSNATSKYIPFSASSMEVLLVGEIGRAHV